jgi:hypothetical protein
MGIAAARVLAHPNRLTTTQPSKEVSIMAKSILQHSQLVQKTIGNVIYLSCSEREPVQKKRHYGRHPRGVISIVNYRKQIGNVQVGDVAIIVTNTFPDVRGWRVKVTEKIPPAIASNFSHKYDGNWYYCNTIDGRLIASAKHVLSSSTCLPETVLFPVVALSK